MFYYVKMRYLAKFSSYYLLAHFRIFRNYFNVVHFYLFLLTKVRFSKFVTRRSLLALNFGLFDPYFCTKNLDLLRAIIRPDRKSVV